MRRLVGRRPSPAMVVALTALFVSMGGVSYGLATGSIGSREIKDSSLRGKDIKRNQITAREIRGRSIDGTDIKLNRVGGNAVKEQSLEVSKIGKIAAAFGADELGGLTLAQVIAQARQGGPAGTQGPPGATGPAGPQGPPGGTGPVSGTVTIDPTAFQLSDPNDDARFEINEASGYIYNISGSGATFGVDAVAPVQLPNAATVTALRCWIYDNSDRNLSSSVYLRSRSVTQVSPVAMSNVSLSTSGVAENAITETSDETVQEPAVEAGEAVWLDLYFYTGDYTGISIRFYGCAIDYSA